MNYTFEILGVAPVLYFFNQQQELIYNKPDLSMQYLGSYKCTLDAFLDSVATVPPQQSWDLERVIQTMIEFWMNNSDTIHYWKTRLADAGKENLLVARVADLSSLKTEFESLLFKNI